MKISFEEFKNQLKEGIEEFYLGSVTAKEHQVMKNNGLMLDGISVHSPGVNMAPTIYVNEFYEKYLSGISFKKIMREFIAVYERNRTEYCFEPDNYKDFEKVKNNIVYKLVNYEKNEELLKQVPHRKVMNLAMVYSCIVNDSEFGNASIMIRNEHVELWNISESELNVIAEKNTPVMLPARFERMSQILKQHYDDPLIDTFDLDIYILTNTKNLNGAACMLYPHLLGVLAEKLSANLYILPSSVHELIVMPKADEGEILRLREMVGEVNMTVVLQEEYLSDEVYYYDKAKGELSIAVD